MELWGRRSKCHRWFYCSTDGDAGDDAWTCPVCGDELTVLENRAATT